MPVFAEMDKKVEIPEQKDYLSDPLATLEKLADIFREASSVSGPTHTDKSVELTRTVGEITAQIDARKQGKAVNRGDSSKAA